MDQKWNVEALNLLKNELATNSKMDYVKSDQKVQFD